MTREWREERRGAVELGVFTGNRAVGLFLAAWALVPLALAGLWGGTLLGFADPSEMSRGLLILLGSGLLGTVVLLFAARAFAGTSTIVVDSEKVVATSGVGPLRWRKSFTRSSWVGAEVVSRGRWWGVELRGERTIRLGGGGRSRAEYLVEHLQPLLHHPTADG